MTIHLQFSKMNRSMKMNWKSRCDWRRQPQDGRSIGCCFLSEKDIRCRERLAASARHWCPRSLGAQWWVRFPVATHSLQRGRAPGEGSMTGALCVLAGRRMCTHGLCPAKKKTHKKTKHREPLEAFVKRLDPTGTRHTLIPSVVCNVWLEKRYGGLLWHAQRRYLRAHTDREYQTTDTLVLAGFLCFHVLHIGSCSKSEMCWILSFVLV